MSIYCLTVGMMVLRREILNNERYGRMNRWSSIMIYTFGEAKKSMIGRLRFPVAAMMITGYLFVAFWLSGSATSACAAEMTNIPSYGKGSWELIIFTDYFCPPCQRVEKLLEPELEKLLARGDVKITFVDYPGHGKKSALYAKFFLSAVAADKSHENAMKARRILFSLAEYKRMDQEKEIAEAMKSQNISLKTINPEPIYKAWLDMIKRYEINATPTCLLRFSSTYTKKYGDADQIRVGLIPELQRRFPGKK